MSVLIIGTVQRCSLHITCSENEIKYVLVYYFHVDSMSVLFRGGGGGPSLKPSQGLGYRGKRAFISG